jgi:hypothetical protein
VETVFFISFVCRFLLCYWFSCFISGGRGVWRQGRAQHSTACGSIVAYCWRFFFCRGYLTALYMILSVPLILVNGGEQEMIRRMTLLIITGNVS